MRVVRDEDGVRRFLSRDGPRPRVGFVPTMGALHEGHAALMRAARVETDVVVASVFVNPRQFDDRDDLARYPRDEERDTAVARLAHVDLLFMPGVDTIYPPGDALSLEVGGAALGFEGAARPGHFNGVALVCLKLFCLVQPAVVYLGQKDAQQVTVLRQLVRDANLGLDIRVVPTARDADGLALSSRNARLSPRDRGQALAIPAALRAAVGAFRGGGDPVRTARETLAAAELDVEYVGVADFAPSQTLVLAVRAGRTRLIDNVPLAHPELAGL